MKRTEGATMLMKIRSVFAGSKEKVMILMTMVIEMIKYADYWALCFIPSFQSVLAQNVLHTAFSGITSVRKSVSWKIPASSSFKFSVFDWPFQKKKMRSLVKLIGEIFLSWYEKAIVMWPVVFFIQKTSHALCESRWTTHIHCFHSKYTRFVESLSVGIS